MPGFGVSQPGDTGTACTDPTPPRREPARRRAVVYEDPDRLPTVPTRTWFRVVRVWWRRGVLTSEPAHRMAAHLTHWATPGGLIRDMPRVMAAYTAHHQVSARTGWKDLARLVDAGLVRKVTGAAPHQAAVYALVLDLARLPDDLPKSLGRAVETTAHDPVKRARGVPTLAEMHASLEECTVVRHGSRSAPHPVTAPGCGRVHTSPYTREGPTPPPPSGPPQREHRPARVTVLGANLDYDEHAQARRVLDDCRTWWLRQRSGWVPPGTETLTDAAARSVEHLVVLLLRYMPPGEAVELLTQQTRSARDLAGVVAYRVGRVLRSVRRRRALPVDEHGQRAERLRQELAGARAVSMNASPQRKEALEEARAAMAAARRGRDRWERADTAAATVRWATEPPPPPEPKPVTAAAATNPRRAMAHARALARARAERAKVAG